MTLKEFVTYPFWFTQAEVHAIQLLSTSGYVMDRVIFRRAVSLLTWRNLARECFCFGSEASEVVRGLNRYFFYRAVFRVASY